MTTTRMMARSLVALFADNSALFTIIISRRMRMVSRGVPPTLLYLCCARNVHGDRRIMAQISVRFGTDPFAWFPRRNCSRTPSFQCLCISEETDVESGRWVRSTPPLPTIFLSDRDLAKNASGQKGTNNPDDPVRACILSAARVMAGFLGRCGLDPTASAIDTFCRVQLSILARRQCSTIISV